MTEKKNVPPFESGNNPKVTEKKIIDLLGPGTSLYVVIDTETDSLHGNVIQLAALFVIVDPNGLCKIYRVYSDYIFPHSRIVITPQAYAIHRITRQRLKDVGRPLLLILRGFASILKVMGGALPVTFVGHNVEYDLRTLRRACGIIDCKNDPLVQGLLDTLNRSPKICTMKRMHWPSGTTSKTWLRLHDLCIRLGIAVDKKKLHSALGDAYYTALCFCHLMKYTLDRPQPDDLSIGGFLDACTPLAGDVSDLLASRGHSDTF